MKRWYKFHFYDGGHINICSTNPFDAQWRYDRLFPDIPYYTCTINQELTDQTQ